MNKEGKPKRGMIAQARYEQRLFELYRDALPKDKVVLKAEYKTALDTAKKRLKYFNDNK